MKHLLLIAALASCSVTAICQDKQNPGSLFDQGDRNPFLDRTARREGDIVTILISETSVASFAASTQSNKSATNNVLKGLGPVLQSLIPALSTGANANQTGGGSTTHTGKFLAAMSVTVRQVLPNGNLIVEGTREINDGCRVGRRVGR